MINLRFSIDFRHAHLTVTDYNRLDAWCKTALPLTVLVSALRRLSVRILTCQSLPHRKPSTRCIPEWYDCYTKWSNAGKYPIHGAYGTGWRAVNNWTTLSARRVLRKSGACFGMLVQFKRHETILRTEFKSRPEFVTLQTWTKIHAILIVFTKCIEI